MLSILIIHTHTKLNIWGNGCKCVNYLDLVNPSTTSFNPNSIHFINNYDQDHPNGKEMKKAKWLSGEALQIAVKRREGKSKGKNERYKHLNAEFQRIARRDKKAFFSDQCKRNRGKQQNGKD